jgi:hypothetical protein
MDDRRWPAQERAARTCADESQHRAGLHLLRLRVVARGAPPGTPNADWHIDRGRDRPRFTDFDRVPVRPHSGNRSTAVRRACRRHRHTFAGPHGADERALFRADRPGAPADRPFRRCLGVARRHRRIHRGADVHWLPFRPSIRVGIRAVYADGVAHGRGIRGFGIRRPVRPSRSRIDGGRFRVGRSGTHGAQSASRRAHRSVALRRRCQRWRSSTSASSSSPSWSG